MNKWSVVYPHIRVLFCNNKHQVAGTCYKQMEKSLILSKRSQTQGNRKGLVGIEEGKSGCEK